MSNSVASISNVSDEMDPRVAQVRDNIVELRKVSRDLRERMEARWMATADLGEYWDLSEEKRLNDVLINKLYQKIAGYKVEPF